MRLIRQLIGTTGVARTALGSVSGVAVGLRLAWPLGDMPAVEGLSDHQVEAVIAFIPSEQQRLGFE